VREEAPGRASEDIGKVVGVEGFRLGGGGEEDGAARAGGGAVLHGSAAREPRRESHSHSPRLVHFPARLFDRNID